MTDVLPDDTAGLRYKTIRSLGAMGGIQLFKKILTFAVSILLYHFLSAKDYGVFALCETSLMVALIFADFGVEVAVIQNQEKPAEKMIQAGWTIRCVLTVITFVLLLAFSGFLGFWLDCKQMVNPLRVVSLTMITNLLVFKAEMALKKNIQYEKLFYPEMMAVISSSALALFFAWKGLGFWSLVAATMLGQVFRISILWFVPAGKFYWSWDPERTRHLLSRGFDVTAITILYFLLFRIVNVAAAQIYGLDAVGFFYLALNWSNFLVIYVLQVMSSVIYGAIAKIGHDKARVRDTYHEFLHRVAFCTVPFAVGLWCLSPELVPLVAGHKWAPAILICKVMCLHGLFRGLSTATQTIMYGLGMFKKMILFLLIEFALFLILAWRLHHLLGVAGLAWSLVISKAVGFVISNAFLSLELKESPHVSIGIVARYMIAGLAMGSVMHAFDVTVPHQYWLIWLHSAVQTIVGVVVYLVAYYLAHGKRLHDLNSIRADLKNLFTAKVS